MSPAECAAVVAGAAGALSAGGALAIFDFLRGTGLSSSLFAVNMLVATSGGDVYGEEDYRRWCEAAGLRRLRRARGARAVAAAAHGQQALTTG